MPSRAMIVVGGGSSTRFGPDKLMADLEGRPLITHAIDAVQPYVDHCVVVCRPETAQEVATLRPEVVVALGGATRTLSEMAGLAALGRDLDLIGIHDAARPVVDGPLIERLFTTAASEGGAVPLFQYESLIIDRRTHAPIGGLQGAQTPQVFRGPDLMAAYVRAAEAGFDGHDTVEIVERFGDVRIVAVPGDPRNRKVTYPRDLESIRKSLSDPSRT